MHAGLQHLLNVMCIKACESWGVSERSGRCQREMGGYCKNI